MSIISPTDLDLLTRHNFGLYSERAFNVLRPGTPYLHNFHLDVVADALDEVRRGVTRRLIVCLPPRSLKSHLASVCFPTWLLGHRPDLEVVAVSYGQELSEDFGRQSRTLIQSPLYKRIFRTRIDPARQAVHAFETTRGGVRFATSIEGSLTGFGADVVIIDDPTKPGQALSEVERHRANNWYSDTLVTASMTS